MHTNLLDFGGNGSKLTVKATKKDTKSWRKNDLARPTQWILQNEEN